MTTFEELLLIVYLLGYFIAVGYQYKLIGYYRPNEGQLNKITAALCIGVLSWVTVGVGYYYLATNRKPTRSKKKKASTTEKLMKVAKDSLKE